MNERSKRAGYTLVELLVVLGVLALALALVAPRLQPGPQAKLRQDTARIADFLRQARNAAMLTGRETRVLIDAQDLTLDRDGRLLTIADRYEIEAETAQNETSEGQAGVRFYPDGRSSGLSLTLANQKAGAKSVRVDWLTGAVRVLDAEAAADGEG